MGKVVLWAFAILGGCSVAVGIFAGGWAMGSRSARSEVARQLGSRPKAALLSMGMSIDDLIDASLAEGKLPAGQ